MQENRVFGQPRAPEDDDDDETIIIVTMRVSEGFNPVRDARVVKCEKCAESVYLAPTSFPAIEEAMEAGRTVKIQCLQCAQDMIRDGKIEMQPLSQIQIDELKREWERDAKKK